MASPSWNVLTVEATWVQYSPSALSYASAMTILAMVVLPGWRQDQLT